MKSNKKLLVSISTALLFALFSNPASSQNKKTGIKRTELQRHNIGTPGIEAVQVVIDFAPGSAFGSHTHPGEEIIYVLEGTLEYEVAGKPNVILKPGQVLFVPAGTVHAAKNVGKVKASELATYIVEIGKPIVHEVK